MKRRSFIGISGMALCTVGLGCFLPTPKYGRVNVQEHGGHWRAWLDDAEVSSDCYEANDYQGSTLWESEN